MGVRIRVGFLYKGWGRGRVSGRQLGLGFKKRLGSDFKMGVEVWLPDWDWDRISRPGCGFRTKSRGCLKGGRVSRWESGSSFGTKGLGQGWVSGLGDRVLRLRSRSSFEMRVRIGFDPDPVPKPDPTTTSKLDHETRLDLVPKPNSNLRLETKPLSQP
ncbi:hypothetical protein TIFTF001_026064 [Ficus carica]|uniref:Uncharacterized protein n=1 Tax=Ficus carica TaxID=3494 RepID=A0AA88DKP2_FICCA|nr:hypothetical protein TIFTF001_026064 [Ficus carica]